MEMETRIWILTAVLGVAWVVLMALAGFTISLIREYMGKMFAKFEELEGKINQLEQQRAVQSHEIEQINSTMREIRATIDLHAKMLLDIQAHRRPTRSK